MNTLSDRAAALSALGHEARLSIFRLLVKAGPEGLNIGELGAMLAIPATTLGHHLSTLVAVELVLQERRGRVVINRANYAVVRKLLDFLTSECCSGVAVIDQKAA